MKTAISLPDDLFHSVERIVRRSKRHRSEVYADALREYVARHAPEEITEALDQVVAGLSESTDDQFASTAAGQTLANTEW